MSVIEHVRRQRAWRDWRSLLDATPLRSGDFVVDLGCGIGHVAALLVERGARVLGLDCNEAFLTAAREQALPNAEFRLADLRALPESGELGGLADGLVSTFSLAYFTEPIPVVSAWLRHLRPEGWIAIVEIDDLFAHEPLDRRSRALLDAYADEAAADGRYDFRMGRRIAGVLEACGCRVVAQGTLADEEFSRQGPVRDDVLTGWTERFELMTMLRVRFGEEFEHVRASFLSSLTSPEHTSQSTVRFAIGVR